MSRKGPFVVLRVIGFLVLVALIIGGGAMAYKAGVMQGISQAPAVATAISKAAESGQSAPIPPMYGREFGYGYGYPMMYGHHFGFFPFGAICGSIFFLFLFVGFMKMMFFRRMMWGGHFHHHHRGPDDRPWGGPPWMRNHDCEEHKEGEEKDDKSKEESKKE